MDGAQYVLQGYLVLLVEQLLHAVLLHVSECRFTELVHEVQAAFISVPQLLTYENLSPELQHGNWTHSIGMSASSNVGLWKKRGHVISPKIVLLPL